MSGLNKVDRPQEPRLPSPREEIDALDRELHAVIAERDQMARFLQRIADHWAKWPDNEGVEVVLGPPADEDGDEGEGHCDFTLGQLRRALSRSRK